MSRPKQVFSDAGDERCLRDHEAVWRYVSLPTLLSYLNGIVFIPSVAKLCAADPFEGHCYYDSLSFNTAYHNHYGTEESKLDEWLLKSSPRWDQSHMTLKQRYLDFIKGTRFVWCWFHSSDESAAMWYTYGKTGVAVQSTVERISAALETTGREFIYGRMTYVDYGSDLNIQSESDRQQDYQHLLRPFFLKRKEYESEDEVRFVTAGPRRDLRGGILLRNLKPELWISAVRLWPGLKPEEARSIREAIGKFISLDDCRKSNLLPDSLDLVDEMPNLEHLDDDSWRNGSDEVPPQLKVL